MVVKCPKCHFENPADTRFCGNCAASLHPSEEISISHTATLETPIEELTRGTTFAGRYEIIEELGKGGMGKVYKVHDTEIKEKVALKLIKPEVAADEKTIERFRNELKYARKIRHDNVCQMYDLGTHEGSYFITMEYVAGEDLKSFIRRSGQLTVGKSISIAKQVCEGLSNAHKLGVIHRDLKPSNIMIDKEGNARIMDFGIARSVEIKGITEAGMMIGTPEYISPEQAEAKEVDHRSDVYSLGVILYEMVTGRRPFEGETPLSIAMKHKSEAPPNPRELNTQVPSDLSRLILKCMEKNKENRYQRADDVLPELSKIEKGITTTERVVYKKKPITLKKITETFGLKKLFIPALVVVAIAAIAIIIWQLLPQKEAVSLPPGKPSIAVLPFKDMSPQKDQEYFCDGMSDSIINALTNIKDLQVVARTSAFSFKDKEQDVREIGKILNVNTVLEGSVQKADNRIRITAQLINVEDGYHLWSERFDREMEDVFAIQDEISLAVVDRLKLKLLGGEKEKLVKSHTENLEAYNLYLKGRYYWNKRTGEGMSKGMEYFQQAIENDPTYALAYVGLADAFSLFGMYGILPPKDVYPKAKFAARKALEIDDTLGEAYTSLGWISTCYDWDWLAAEREFTRAIELNPNYEAAHLWYAYYLAVMGRFDEAINEVKRAQELDPLSLIINASVGSIFTFTRQYDEAIEQFRKTLEMNPNFLFAQITLEVTYSYKEMWEEAIVEIQRALTITGDWPYALGYHGLAYALSGQTDEAVKVLNRLNEISKERYVSPLYKGWIYLGLGEIDKSFELHEKAYLERDPSLIFLNAFPAYDKIRSDPKFTALLKKMGLE